MTRSYYTVTIRMRGTVGKRATAARRFRVWADSPAAALAQAQERAKNQLIWEVKTTDA
jgi:hypothetical protein